MNVKEAATYLGCTFQQVRYLIREGRIKGQYQTGPDEKGVIRTRYEIDRDSLEAYRPSRKGRPRTAEPGKLPRKSLRSRVREGK